MISDLFKCLKHATTTVWTHTPNKDILYQFIHHPKAYKSLQWYIKISFVIHFKKILLIFFFKLLTGFFLFTALILFCNKLPKTLTITRLISIKRSAVLTVLTLLNSLYSVVHRTLAAAHYAVQWVQYLWCYHRSHCNIDKTKSQCQLI